MCKRPRIFQVAILELQCFWIILPQKFIKIGKNHLWSEFSSEQFYKLLKKKPRYFFSVLVSNGLYNWLKYFSWWYFFAFPQPLPCWCSSAKTVRYVWFVYWVVSAVSNYCLNIAEVSWQFIFTCIRISRNFWPQPYSCHNGAGFLNEDIERIQFFSFIFYLHGNLRCCSFPAAW